MRLLTPFTLIAWLTVLLPLVLLFGLFVGPAQLSLAETAGLLWQTLIGSATSQNNQLILFEIRLPRIVLAALVGAVLASCGAVLQGLFRNPLADPTLIGVSSGASVGASAAIVLGAWLMPEGSGAVFGGLPLLTVGAFLGGLLAAWVVYQLATGPEGTSVATMLLAGIAISALAMALNSLFSFIADDSMLRRISLWQMGAMDKASWNDVVTLLFVAAILVMLLPRDSEGLNAMLLGESEARHLGVSVESLKRRVIVLTALGVGVAVALVGMVAFVGLIVPHWVRLLIGPDHKTLLPATALLGAALLVLADALARTLVSPAELPIGVVTALLGGPFFIALLLRQRRVLR